MSILDGPIWSRCIIALTCPARVTFPAHTEQGTVGSKVGMNVTAHRKKKKNGETKTGRKGRRQATDFKEAVCCPSAGRSGEKHSKKMVQGGAPGVTWTLGKGQKPFRPNPNGVGDRTSTLRRPVDW